MAKLPAYDANYSAPVLTTLPSDAEMWENLKQVIASSSGFHRWQQDCDARQDDQELSLDDQVRGYLRQTLETLAY
ncbi:MAG: hypothetical protein NZ772_13375 [Cyanobacteria bacterium]|nr:hypothetical protein [Cyanobacteriota bacterium]MDW8202382.1 hypothetical protein [Cyanobacteriota bacterium SKYGB_h_bin112]